MKKKVISTMLLVVLVAVLSIGGTLAWLTDDDAVTNTFTVGNVEILLDEALVKETTDATTGAKEWVADAEEARVQKNEYKGIYPGAVLPKDPTVKNTGSEPAYIRVSVTVNNWNILTADNVGIKDLETVFTVEDDFAETWKRVDIVVADNTATYTYEYIANNGILAKAATTGPLFTEVTVPALLNSEQMAKIGSTLQMDIKAYAIQARGFADAEEAFAAYAAQNK